MSLITLLEYASVLVFAITGALVASRAQLDLVGFAFIACLTALGGGTLRDLLLDRNPIFWIANPTHLAVGVTAAMVVFFTAHLLESRYRALLWLDSVALAVAVAAGTGVAISLDQSAVVVVLMGMIT
ncbi:MAG: trimeric intracellular cation channel family protein, partial [Sulfitobacter sp.]|nr:trimeric intracellular cation channel family protein [Sulfitobacter sp.]